MYAVRRFPFLNIRSRMSSFKLPSEPTVFYSRHINDLFYKDKISELHTSADQRQIDTAVKAVGCGIAAIGTGTAALGVGYVFGKLIEGASRNPSLKQQLFTYAILGLALCEALGLFAFLMGMLALFN